MVEAQLKQGVEEFNSGHYFECHDTLENLWMETRGEDRLFLQGLIHVSVGFYHFFNGNYRGAASQLSKGLRKLHPYSPVHRGIELKNFLAGIVPWFAEAERGVRVEPIHTEHLTVPQLQFVYTPSEKEN